MLPETSVGSFSGLEYDFWEKKTRCILAESESVLENENLMILIWDSNECTTWSCKDINMHIANGLSEIKRILAQSAGSVEYTDCFSNEYPGYDTKESDGEVPVMLEIWGMRSTSSLPLLPDLLWPRMAETDNVLSMRQIELNCVRKLNWIAWNRTVVTFKLRTYAELNCLEWNCFRMLNWIARKRIVLTF